MIEAIRKIGECVTGGVLDKDALLDGICQRLDDKITRTKKNGEKEEIIRNVVFLNLYVFSRSASPSQLHKSTPKAG